MSDEQPVIVPDDAVPPTIQERAEWVAGIDVDEDVERVDDGDA